MCIRDRLEGVQVTTYAFQNGLPFPPVVSSFGLMMCLVFFAVTTILGWDYYSERCLEYLTGGNMKKVMVFRWIYILAVDVYKRQLVYIITPSLVVFNKNNVKFLCKSHIAFVNIAHK